MNTILLAAALSFATPPREAMPEVWFHLIGSNVSREGITSDLEAIAAAGFSGIHFFHEDFGGQVWPGCTPGPTCLSGGWDGLVRHVGTECHRLGLGLFLQNCPGWSMAGGPWIAPTNAMRDLVFSRTLVKGPQRQLRLPRPKAADGNPARDYRDIAVVAFPTPDGETAEPFLVPIAAKGTRVYTESAVSPAYQCWPWMTHEKNPQPLSSSDSDARWLAAFGDHPTTLGFNGSGTERCEISFASSVTLRTLRLSSVQAMNHRRAFAPDVIVTVEAFGSGAFRRVGEWRLPDSNWYDGHDISLAIPETTASRFRVSIRHAYAIRLQYLRLLSQAVPHNFEADAAFTLRARMRDPEPATSPKAFVRQSDLVDLTDELRADGSLDWTRTGAWTILRIGHVNSLHRNGPAPEEARGWECDKLSPRAVDLHYNAYVGRLARGPLKGLVDGFLCDSWECGSQTWTEGWGETFAAKRGYGLSKFWPALCGYVVDDRETTRAFLADWRRTLSEGVSEAFYGRLSERAQADGLAFAAETAGGDVFPGDILEYWKQVPLPMCEFWQPRTKDFVGSIDYKSIRPCASAAHLYGHRRVSCESFTGIAMWNETLFDLKDVANFHFAQGVTHNVMQAWVHDPRGADAPGPGSSLGRNGLPLGRRQTWYPFLREFVTYLGRCTTLLERGRPVQDVLMYVGDDTDHKPREEIEFPPGLKYDLCTADALQSRLTVKNGVWTTPDDIRYPILWLRDCHYLRPETKAHLAAARAQGACVVRQLRDAPLPPPDFTGGGTNLVWCHRADERADWYFVATDGPRPWKGTVRLRATGNVSLWDPVDGSIAAPTAVEKDGAFTRVALDLPPSGAVFVMLERHGANPMPTPTISAKMKLAEGTRSFLGKWRTLDLGNVVGGAAEVFVNGQSCGKRWCPPYRFDLLGKCRDGENALEVRFTGTWWNLLLEDAERPAEERKTWTPYPPPLGSPRMVEGVFGPMVLEK